MTTSESSVSLRATLAHFAAQAHDAVFGQFLAIADAQARYDLGKPAGGSGRNSKRRERVVEHLRALQSAPMATGKGPLKRKEDFATALPIEDPELEPGPLFSSKHPPKHSALDLATFFHRQWERHFDLGRTNRRELFCHPDSLNYNEERELAHRSEGSVGSLQLSALLTRLYGSPDAEVRKAATTFRRAPTPISWDDFRPTEASAFYRPEATYTFKGQQTAICLPEGFCWKRPSDIAPFLEGVLRLLSHNWTAYEFWCPGLCRCPDSPAELRAFLARTQRSQA
jgi:hypothetical protein